MYVLPSHTERANAWESTLVDQICLENTRQAKQKGFNHQSVFSEYIITSTFIMGRCNQSVAASNKGHCFSENKLPAPNRPQRKTEKTHTASSTIYE